MTGSTTPITTPSITDPTGRNGRDVAGTLTILHQLFAGYGPRDFSVRLWDGTIVPPDPGLESRFAFILNRPGALRRMLLPPNEVALGEAYLDGDFDIEGDMVAAMRLEDGIERVVLGPGELLSLTRRVMALPSEPHRKLERAELERRTRIRGAEHSKERDQQAITYHYDVGNDYYQLFLDSRMVYSCAYFPAGMGDLDTAQVAKLEHTCRKLRLRAGERLLDIGCGWGALIMHAASRFGVDATGITLSRAQAELANSRIQEAGLTGRCRVLLLDYRDLATLGPFDKMASVGMVEHVGMSKLPAYFGAAWEGLRPGGLFLNHGITSAAKDVSISNPLDRFVFQKGGFTRKYVFPDGELIPLGDTLAVAERAGFEVRDVESLREHYALTLRHWVRRLESRREEAVRLAGERIYRIWRLYMAGSCHSFFTARLSVHQSLLAKPDHGMVPLPMDRADLYATSR